MTLLEALKRLQIEGPSCPLDGICQNAAAFEPGVESRLCAEAAATLRAMYKDGLVKKAAFPVKHPLFDDNEDAYFNDESPWQGEYGENRRALLAVMIDYVELNMKGLS